MRNGGPRLVFNPLMRSHHFHPRSSKPSKTPIGWVILPWIGFAGFTLLLTQCSPVAPSMSKVSVPVSTKADSTTAQQTDGPKMVAYLKVAIKNSAHADAAAEKRSFSLEADDLETFKKFGKLTLSLPDQAVPASIQTGVLKLDLGKSDLASEDVMGLDIAIVKDGDSWVLKISDSVAADLSQRIRDRLLGVTVTYSPEIAPATPPATSH